MIGPVWFKIMVFRVTWSMRVKVWGIILLLCMSHLSFGREGPLVVATTKFSPFIIEQRGQTSGFCIDLWEKIANLANVEYELLILPTLPAVLSAVQSGQADVAIGGLPITLKHEKSMDFSYPFFESGNQILTLKNQKSFSIFGKFGLNFFNAFFSLDVLKVIIFLLFLLFLSANIVWVAERKKNPEMFPEHYLQGVWESFWWSSVTITTVGYGDKTPKSLVGRLCALVWMFAGIFIISYFTATISSQNTIASLQHNFNTPHDLIGKQVGTAKGSTSYRYLKVLGVRMFQFNTIDTAYKALRKGLISAVVFDAPVLQYYVKQDMTENFLLGNTIFQKQFYGMGFPKDSEFLETVNQALLYLQETNEYDLVYEKWFGKSP